ncbi:MAG: hypothetical protein KDC38_14215, partial [Planctomycetes bacterium]|nr:hypothetical protein [Planctomycetota bacterium]
TAATGSGVRPAFAWLRWGGVRHVGSDPSARVEGSRRLFYTRGTVENNGRVVLSATPVFRGELDGSS